MNEDTQQRICTSQPFCLCVGDVNEWDECDCFAGANGRCVVCRAPMEVIDRDTGQTVEAAA
jgi:hypothetical protein